MKYKTAILAAVIAIAAVAAVAAYHFTKEPSREPNTPVEDEGKVLVVDHSVNSLIN